MRVKHILDRLSVGARLKIVYERITLTRFTTAFTFIALAHCLVQIALQSTALSFNKQASDRVSHLISESQIPRQYSFVSKGKLFVCKGLPPSGDPFDTVCWAIAGPGVAVHNTTQMDDDDTHSEDDKKAVKRSQTRFAHELRTPTIIPRALSAVPIFDNGSVSVTSVNVTGLNSTDPEAVTQLSAQCVKALNWPSLVLRDAQREDVAFMFYQVWLLGMSLVTILNESIPHLVAALVTHGMSTAWSVFQVSRTGRYERQYQTLVVSDTCGGVDVMPNFWRNRMDLFIPILVLNAVALLISLGVALKLFNIYARQTFKRVGASKKMNVRYSYVLFFSVLLQLSAFFTISGSALWIDTLNNGVLHGPTAYRVVFTITSVVEFPWVIMGWISIRREHRAWSLVFLIVGLGLCAAWTSMFANVLYRWSFQNFPFFAALSISAYIVLVSTVVFGVVCRINFGKGLPQYLKTEEKFDDSSFIPVIIPVKRQSRLVSVFFPDKRTSAVRKGGSFDEKPPLYSSNPYDRHDQRPSSESSIIDIKAPSLHQSMAVSVVTNSSSVAPEESKTRSILSRARAPFLRLSDNSRLGTGKMSLRFSTFTSSTSISDLEGSVPDVPMPLPKVPPSTYKPQIKRSAPTITEPVKPAPKITRSLSSSTRAAELPAINVIPASVARSFTFAEQGDLSVRAASETRDSFVPSTGRMKGYAGAPRTPLPLHTRSDSSHSVHSVRSGFRGSPPGGGLPSNPRAYRN